MSGGSLPPDTADSFRADLMAMRRDAREWAAAAQRMGQAAAVAQQLSIDEFGFSLLASRTGLIEEYGNMQAWVAGLLEGARDNLVDMATALAKAADNYEASDATGAQSFDQLGRKLIQGSP